jgi:hypothetical protein
LGERGRRKRVKIKGGGRCQIEMVKGYTKRGKDDLCEDAFVERYLILTNRRLTNE